MALLTTVTQAQTMVPAVLDTPSELIIQVGSILHQHILQSDIPNLDDEMDPDDNMDSDDDMDPHDKDSDAETITPRSQANYEQNHAVDGSSTSVGNQAQTLSSGNSTYGIDHIKAALSKEKTRHGYKQGAARFRSGQRLAANEQLSKQVSILHAQLNLAKDSAKVELTEEFNRHVANVEIQAQAKEDARMAEWVRRSISRVTCLIFVGQIRIEDRIKQREETATAEQARAVQIIKEKEAEAEALRVASIQRENEMRNRMDAVLVGSHAYNAELAKMLIAA